MMNEEERREGQAQPQEEILPRHDSGEEQPSSRELYKFPRPIRRPTNDTQHKKQRSKAQERGIARSYGIAGFKTAKRIPGSGAFQGLKGDVDPGEWFLGECKQTRGGRLVIDPRWYDKIEYEARNLGRPWWAVHAWIGDETSNYRRVVILNEPHFFELIRQLKGYESGEGIE